jgi:cellular nucleic acid-binding protein
MKCYACGKLGHISRDCTAPNGGPLNSVGKVCYKCGQAGHISRECTAIDTNGQVGQVNQVGQVGQVGPVGQISMDPPADPNNQVQPPIAPSPALV